jgi:hypothetical protein
MFVWTMVILIGYLVVLWNHYRQGLPSLPTVPEGLVVLMGISHGAYLGTKATEKAVDIAEPKTAGVPTPEKIEKLMAQLKEAGIQ